MGTLARKLLHPPKAKGLGAAPRKAIVDFSMDEATYVGDGTDGVYYQVGKGRGGWYATVVVDSDTGHFTDTIYSDEGPFKTKRDAELWAAGEAYAWCESHEVSTDDDDNDD